MGTSLLAHRGLSYPSNMQQAPQVGPAEVAVFWDYENIQIPSGYSAAKTSDAIRTKVLPFGRIVDRKLYYDSSRHSERGDFLRSELDSSGFTLVDCPNRNTKETLDKKLIVDVLFFAWERVSRGAKACIVLITCDGDYSYTLARLRDIGVLTVIVTRPNGVAKVLRENADVVVSWGDDVLVRQREEEETPTFRKKVLEMPTFQRKVEEAPSFRKFFEETPILRQQVEEVPTIQKKFEEVSTIQKHLEEAPTLQQHVELEAPTFRQYVEEDASISRHFVEEEAPTLQKQVEEALPIRMQVKEAPAIRKHLEEAPILRQQVEDAPTLRQQVDDEIPTTIHPPQVVQAQPATYSQVAQAAPFVKEEQELILPCDAETFEHKYNSKSDNDTHQQEAKFELLAKFLKCILCGQEQASAADGGSLYTKWALEATVAEEFYKKCGICDKQRYQDVKRHGLEGKFMVVGRILLGDFKRQVVRCDDDDDDKAGKSTATYLQLTLDGFELLRTHSTSPPLAQAQPTIQPQVTQAPIVSQVSQQPLLPCGAKTSEHKSNNGSNNSTHQQEAKVRLLVKFLECVLDGQRARYMDGRILHMRWVAEGVVGYEFHKKCGGRDTQRFQDVRRHGLEGNFMVVGRKLLQAQASDRKIVRCDDGDNNYDRAVKSTETYLQLTQTGFAFLRTHSTSSSMAQAQPTIQPQAAQVQPTVDPQDAQAQPTLVQENQQSLLPCGAKISEHEHNKSSIIDTHEHEAKYGLLVKFLECVLNRQRAMDGGSLHTRWASEATIVDEFYKNCGSRGKQNCYHVKILGLKGNFMVRGRRLLEDPNRRVVRCEADDSVNNRVGKSFETYLQLTQAGFAFLRTHSTTGEGGTQT